MLRQNLSFRIPIWGATGPRGHHAHAVAGMVTVNGLPRLSLLSMLPHDFTRRREEAVQGVLAAPSPTVRSVAAGHPSGRGITSVHGRLAGRFSATCAAAEGNVKGVGFPIIESLRKSLENNETWHVVIRRRGLRVTELGKRFCQICVISHDQKGLPTQKHT
jgi:hypothetical protein